MVHIAQITSGLRKLRVAYTVGLNSWCGDVVLWGYQGWLFDSSSLRFWPLMGPAGWLVLLCAVSWICQHSLLACGHEP
jgi:hypothetical protein